MTVESIEMVQYLVKKQTYLKKSPNDGKPSFGHFIRLAAALRHVRGLVVGRQRWEEQRRKEQRDELKMNISRDMLRVGSNYLKIINFQVIQAYPQQIT